MGCDEEAASVLRAHVATLPWPALSLLGPGEYHYLTRLLLERVAEPFALVLIDNHADASGADWGRGTLRCDGWVPRPGELGMLQKVAWIGVSEQADAVAALGWGERGWLLPDARSAARLGPWLGHLPLYVSVDKDVLHPDDATTHWSHGTMGLEELCGVLEELLRGRRLVGADLTGELSDAPARALEPSWLAGRARNRRANRRLLDRLGAARFPGASPGPDPL
jgi:hypothetical protein